MLCVLVHGKGSPLEARILQLTALPGVPCRASFHLIPETMDLPLGSQGLQDGVIQARIAAQYKRLYGDLTQGTQEAGAVVLTKEADIGAVSLGMLLSAKWFSKHPCKDRNQFSTCIYS